MTNGEELLYFVNVYLYLTQHGIRFYEYCRIIIVRGGSMFVDFVGYPYPRIYVPVNFKQSIELSCIVMRQTSYPGKKYPHGPAVF